MGLAKRHLELTREGITELKKHRKKGVATKRRIRDFSCGEMRCPWFSSREIQVPAFFNGQIPRGVVR